MTAKILFYSCLFTAVAATANDRRDHTSMDDHSMIEDTQTETLNGDTRRVRTAGRAEDPATGMASPSDKNAGTISEMNDGAVPSRAQRQREQKAQRVQSTRSTSSSPAGTMPASRSTTSPSTATGTTAATTARTADDQARMSQADLEITRQIREDLVNDKDLSVRAQNLTVITEGGRVVIRGSVPTSSEKDAVERIARGVSGVSSVLNQVTVSR